MRRAFERAIGGFPASAPAVADGRDRGQTRSARARGASVTSTGLVVIPLGLLIILLPWRLSIIALLVFATLNSAAVVNVGKFGLQPGYFFGILIIARTLVEIVVFKARLNAHVLRILTPLLLFTIISFISIWVGLAFFQGKIMVIDGTAGLNLALAQPYTFRRQNLTQPVYLLLNIGIVYALAHQVARLPADQVTPTLDRAVLGATLFASLIAIWEMAEFYFGLPFFPKFFHSNAGYYVAYDQVLFGAILRVSGPFTEPSDLAYHFAAFLMYAWYRYLRKPSTGAMGVIVLCIAIMAASTATTAFVVLGFFVLVMIKDFGVALVTAQIRTKLSTGDLGALVLLGAATLGAFVFIQSNWSYIDGVVTSMLLEKQQSSSFASRSGADLMALDIVIQTGGIGIGLGSHKPNNLAMTLLSNTGVIGFLTFAVFLFDLIRVPAGTDRRSLLRPLRWAVIGLLLVHLMANPNLSTAMLWISFALVIGLRGSQCGDPLPAAVPAPVIRSQGPAAFAHVQRYGGG
jgi:hypothetical protein